MVEAETGSEVEISEVIVFEPVVFEYTRSEEVDVEEVVGDELLVGWLLRLETKSSRFDQALGICPEWLVV